MNIFRLPSIKGNFVQNQENSKYLDSAPLTRVSKPDIYVVSFTGTMGSQEARKLLSNERASVQ